MSLPLAERIRPKTLDDIVIIALESTTANGVGVDEVPKVGEVRAVTSSVINCWISSFIWIPPIVYFL